MFLFDLVRLRDQFENIIIVFFGNQDRLSSSPFEIVKILILLLVEHSTT